MSHFSCLLLCSLPSRVLILTSSANFRRLAFLSGPSFAAEVAKGLPTAVTIACEAPATAQRAQALLSTPRFRCYRTTDVVGK
jgi:glycerol-3-phosphate dehydrogenase